VALEFKIKHIWRKTKVASDVRKVSNGKRRKLNKLVYFLKFSPTHYNNLSGTTLFIGHVITKI